MIFAGIEDSDHCEKKNQILTAKASYAFLFSVAMHVT